MSPIIQLDKIIEVISLQTQGVLAFVNKKTGETALVEEDLLDALQEEFNEEDDLGWCKEMIAEAKQILTTEDWLDLPNTFDFHEWQVMKESKVARMKLCGMREIFRHNPVFHFIPYGLPCFSRYFSAIVVSVFCKPA